MSFVPIRLRTLIPNIEFDFSVFIKIQNKYILYIREGDDIERGRLEHLRKKNVKQLFISYEDEKRYQTFLDKGLFEAAENPMMSAEERAHTASGVAESAVEDMHEEPEKLASFKLLERAAKGIVNIVGKKSDVLKEFYAAVKKSKSETCFKHAITVASLTTCMGDEMELSDAELADLGVASMLLDVGVIKMPGPARKLFTKKYDEFTAGDWTAYKEHPQLGVEILNGKKYINPEILDLVYTHEERKSGDGFPNGVITANVKQEIIAVCSCYDRMVTCLGMSHKDAKTEMQVNQLGNFDLEMIKRLLGLLKKQEVKD